MKFWAILALLTALLAVFLRIGQTEEIDGSDVFVEKALQDEKNGEEMWVLFNFYNKISSKL